ncbi:MAG: hypothetical protein ACI80W_001132, partial [Porticoccaceae bacterium]
MKNDNFEVIWRFLDYNITLDSGRVSSTKIVSVKPTRNVNPMFDKDQTIAKFDPELWQSIQQEDQRQEQHIELIASENYTSPAVMEAQGGKMTNKYAEGYPGKRYYGGCEFVDVAEQLAIDRLKSLYGSE